MTELQITELKEPGRIAFNYEELKAELEEKCRSYELAVYTESTLKLAKEDRANLNRLKKALNDERIRREREFMAPFLDFKAKVNEIIGIIDKPVAIIDRQIKDYEESAKQRKAAEIEDWFTQNRQETGAPPWLSLRNIANPKWANASFGLEQIKAEIKERVAQINADIATINALEGFSFEAMAVYTKTYDLNRAINEGRELYEMKQEAERRRKEAEAAAKARLEALEAEKAEKAANTTPEDKKPEFKAENATQEQKNEAGSTQDAQKAPEGKWVRFAAFLTTAQAFALRDWFKARGIEFKAV